jgi:hypothetical protein
MQLLNIYQPTEDLLTGFPIHTSQFTSSFDNLVIAYSESLLEAQVSL